MSAFPQEQALQSGTSGSAAGGAAVKDVAVDSTAVGSTGSGPEISTATEGASRQTRLSRANSFERRGWRSART